MKYSAEEMMTVVAARELVRTFHSWLNPRLLAAAALSNGEDVRTALKEVS